MLAEAGWAQCLVVCGSEGHPSPPPWPGLAHATLAGAGQHLALLVGGSWSSSAGSLFICVVYTWWGSHFGNVSPLPQSPAGPWGQSQPSAEEALLEGRRACRGDFAHQMGILWGWSSFPSREVQGTLAHASRGGVGEGEVLQARQGTS